MELELLNIQMLIGFILMMVTFYKIPSLLMIDKDFVLKFLKIMLLINVPLRIGLMALSHGGPVSEVTYRILDMPLSVFLGVFWEDAFYVLPVLIMRYYQKLAQAAGQEKRRKTFKLIADVATPILALLFMHGHAYQGWVGMLTIIYWFFSYSVGKKRGLGTSMICHILFDVIAVVLIHVYAQLIIAGVI